ncbi:MAG: KTSC domain-containing protein [Nitrosopumilaceae archaeon]|nr:KTSC domain-containing protein [Nitrosopumilaceae archaeon]NIU86807.1 KTSC domain-containing protein [Nitrosopumilaceae archaeon]NIX61004.1 KTSC domain-containing protein [Nitrosopumilaceae archaeon]
MKLEFTNDSWIEHVKYDTETKRMVIKIRGSKDTYECEGVEQDVYDAFKAASSKGKFFNANIKGQYNKGWFDP